MTLKCMTFTNDITNDITLQDATLLEMDKTTPSNHLSKYAVYLNDQSD